MESKRFSISLDGVSFELVATVRDAGEEMLFFLHGLGCSKASFRHFWKRPDLADHSALALDLIGFGESTKSDAFSYTMEDQARVCGKILSEYSDKKLHIVAHSMGGAVALLLPDEILNSTISFANVEGNLILADCDIASRKIIDVGPDVFESKILPALTVQYASLGEGYFEMESTTANALYRSAQSLVSWSATQRLLEAFLALSCRKTYFYGDKNAGHPTVAQVTNIAKIEIKDSGHFPMNDNPDHFYTALYKFVRF